LTAELEIMMMVMMTLIQTHGGFGY